MSLPINLTPNLSNPAPLNNPIVLSDATPPMNLPQDWKNPINAWWQDRQGATAQKTITTSGLVKLSDIIGTSTGRAKVFIEACGGGGGGSALQSTPVGGYTGGGGGGSGYVATFEGIFSADYVFDITVGAGGTGGAPGFSGGNGGATIIKNTMYDERSVNPSPPPRCLIDNDKTILLSCGGGSGGNFGDGGAGGTGTGGYSFGGGGGASIYAPAPGGGGGLGSIPAYNGQDGDASPFGPPGTGFPGSGGGVGGFGNFGYSDDRNNNGGGGGGGGLQSSGQGKGGSGDAYGPPTNGALGCGGGGACYNYFAGMLSSGGNGGSGYVNITAQPIP